MSTASEMMAGLVSAAILVFFQFPVALYLLYLVLTVLGGARLWSRGWGHPIRVFAVSRAFGAVLGAVVILMAATSSGGGVSPYFGVGVLAGVVIIHFCWLTIRRRKFRQRPARG